MPDPGRVTPRAAEVLLVILEYWLLPLRGDGDLPPGAEVRALLAGIVLATPGVAARRCCG